MFNTEAPTPFLAKESNSDPNIAVIIAALGRMRFINVLNPHAPVDHSFLFIKRIPVAGKPVYAIGLKGTLQDSMVGALPDKKGNVVLGIHAGDKRYVFPSDFFSGEKVKCYDNYGIHLIAEKGIATFDSNQHPVSIDDAEENVPAIRCVFMGITGRLGEEYGFGGMAIARNITE